MQMISDTDSQPRQALYFVDQDEERWVVSHSGARYPYQSRRIAIEAAVDAANSSGNRGYEARVLVRGEDGAWQPFWVYGEDPHPWSGEEPRGEQQVVSSPTQSRD